MCNVKLAVLGRKWGGMEDFCSRSNNETFWWRIAFSWEVTDTRFPRSGTNQTSLTLLWIFTSHCIPMKHEQFHTEPIPVSMNLWPGQSHSVTVKHTLGSGSLRWRPDPLGVGMFGNVLGFGEVPGTSPRSRLGASLTSSRGYAGSIFIDLEHSTQ